MKLFYAFLLFFSLPCMFFAQQNYPEPKASKTRLFYIQHSSSKNTYVYDVNLKNNTIDDANPINIYKILFEKDGRITNLSLTQRKLAYGYTASKISDTNYSFSFAANKNHILHLLQRDKSFVVQTVVNNQPMLIEKLFIQMKENQRPFKFVVDYILFYGKDPKTNKKLVEKFYPQE